MKKKYYIYILTNKSNMLYIGVTNNLQRRIFEHRNKLIKGYTSKYNLCLLIYFEEYSNPEEAISREKQLKGWTRMKKMKLIKTKNLEFEEILLT